MTCNCEFGGKCSMVSECYMDQELADKQEDIDALKADNEGLRAERDALRDKALRFDLDQLGIERREAEAVELVELRAERDAPSATRCGHGSRRPRICC